MFADARIVLGDLELPGRDNLVLFKSSRDLQTRGTMGGESASKLLGALAVTAEAYGIAESEAVSSRLRSNLRLRDTLVAFITATERLSVEADSIEYKLLGTYGSSFHYWLTIEAKRGRAPKRCPLSEP